MPFRACCAVFGENISMFGRIWYGVHDVNRELVLQFAAKRRQDKDRRKKPYLPIVLLLASVAALAVGIVELFELRFEGGDVYPSTPRCRADPLGTMAIYESLPGLPGFSVRRDFRRRTVCPTEKRRLIHVAGPIEAWRQLSPALLRAQIEQSSSAEADW